MFYSGISALSFPGEHNADTLCWWGFILKLCFFQKTMLTPYVGEVLYWNCVFPRTQFWHLMLVRFYIETVFFPEHNADTLCWWGFILKLCFSQNTMLTPYVGEIIYWNCVFPRTQCWHLMLVRFYIETVFFPEHNVDTLCWWGFILKLCFSQKTMLTPYVGEVLYWNCVFPRTQCWHLMLVRFYIETVFFPEHNVDTLCWWGFILKLCFFQKTMLTPYVGEVLY